MNPGSIVRCRNRDWVMLPSDDQAIYRLRPLTGALDEVVAVHKRLSDIIGYSLPAERITSATFPLPSADDLADAASARLLWQAARLTLREGAAPLRSLGKISIRPRTYQFVPLLMALRLDPVRMLIADDVGVGKTIEALLIARELLDRGEIKRFCVLCPPSLCDQWQKELAEKFNLDAVVIGSGTVRELDRQKKTDAESIYRYYPVQVASIDFLKTDRNKHLFLLDCPDLIIVDEAHGSAVAAGNEGQHQRHQLVRELAAKDDRHLILLTATPHSGIESAFRSLLALLDPKFANWDTAALAEPQRVELARHFVQRTRRDIEHQWDGEHCFPQREASDETYRLSDAYRELFTKTYDFCSEIVRTGQALERRKQRVRYWGALALLRCVMSSPAAAVAALASRHDALGAEDEGLDFRSLIFESADDRTDDDQPTPPIELAEQTLPEADRRRLRDLGRLADDLKSSPKDTKLQRCAELVKGWLAQGLHPIVWCRYIATAEYLAEQLARLLKRSHPDVRVIAITGRIGDDERREKVKELSLEPCRVLVATDCLSEGINLQDAFNVVVHYDLPWNPNRLEQREGRVDRYGQPQPVVRCVRYFSPDSPVDGVVLEVLLNKAREIHRTLGTHVPVPDESETVTEALLNALFLRSQPAAEEGPMQLQLDFGIPEVESFHRHWDASADREKINRTRFAQRALKPDEVRRELEEADEVLGDPDAVREFVLAAAQRLGLTIARDVRAGDVFRVAIGADARATLPAAIESALPVRGNRPPAASKRGKKKPKSADDESVWLISFTSPTPDRAEYLGRNHPFVAALARYLMEEALTKHGAATASRCGVIRTRAVERLTTIMLLRVRYLLHQPQHPAQLCEEVQVMGYAGSGKNAAWLADDDALRLLGAQPDANVPLSEKRELVQAALNAWPAIEPHVLEQIGRRGADLERSHKRIRQAVALRVRELRIEPQFPPDLLGVLVLQPVA